MFKGLSIDFISLRNLREVQLIERSNFPQLTIYHILWALLFRKVLLNYVNESKCNCFRILLFKWARSCKKLGGRIISQDLISNICAFVAEYLSWISSSEPTSKIRSRWALIVFSKESFSGYRPTRSTFSLHLRTFLPSSGENISKDFRSSLENSKIYCRDPKPYNSATQNV